MITTVPYNEYSCGDLIVLLKKYGVKNYKIKPKIVSKEHTDFGEFMLSFEICEVIFENPEDESAFVLKLEHEEITNYIDKTSLQDMGFDYE